MKDRVLRDFTIAEIQELAGTVHSWQSGNGYTDQPGYCKSISLDEIRRNEYVLTPGRYVGTEKQEDDGKTFAEKMAPLVAEYCVSFLVSLNTAQS